MKYILILLLAMTAQSANAQNQVIVNKVPLSKEIIDGFRNQYGIQMQPGDYWYDQACGAWGYTGGPTMGFLVPGLQLGGKMSADASNGNTGVFINGRQLHAQDLLGLQQLLGPVMPGRYWLDGYGNAGYQGGPAIVNLWQVAQSQQSTFYRNSYTGIGAGSSGGTSYVMGKDWSVIVGN